MTIHLFLSIICLGIAAICGIVLLAFWATGELKSDEKRYSSFFNKLFNITDEELEEGF